MNQIERAIDDLLDLKWRIQEMDGETEQDCDALRMIVDDLDDMAMKLRMVNTI
jgi:hypothetical protein